MALPHKKIFRRLQNKNNRLQFLAYRAELFYIVGTYEENDPASSM